MHGHDGGNDGHGGGNDGGSDGVMVIIPDLLYSPLGCFTAIPR